MTRFGVMKHLRVLEEAGLVVTRRRGREKLHFLNPVPIRLVHDRWVSKYAEPWAATLSDLKHELEDRTMEKVFEIYIKTTPERLWEAITESRAAAQVQLRRGRGVRLDERLALRRHRARSAEPILEGENLEVDPPRRLVQSFNACWSDDVKAEGTSRVTWEIEPVADSCRLTVIHDQLREGANGQLYGGWPMILSGLKTLLETGRAAHDPGLAALRGGLVAGAGRLTAQLVPRESIRGQLVVVAGLGHVPMGGHAEIRGAVQGSGRDADRRPARRVPEQARAALGAEAAAGAGLAVGALDPAQAAVLHEHEVLAARGRARREVSVPAPALDAVADQHVAERSGDLVPNRAAQASSRCHRSPPRSQ